MMGTISVRHAHEGDAESIASMVRALAAHIQDESLTSTTAESWLSHGFGNDPAFQTLIAEAETDAVGYCLFTRTYSTWRAAPGVFVVDLFVADRARGLGVGRRLLSGAADWGMARGCAFLKLDVDPTNVTAKGFYEKIGFRDDHDRAMVIERDQFNAFE